MKGINAKKIAAIAAGALMLGASVAIADVVYGNVQLVDQTGQPVVKVVVGSNAMASDGVAAANIAASIANLAYKSSQLSAQAMGNAVCTATGASSGSAGTCAVTNKQATLEVTVPGVIGGAYQFKTLVNDYVDRQLGNRVNTNSEDLYYGTTTTSDLQEDINPFRFITGGNTSAVYKIDGSSYSPLATTTLQDPKASNTYTEIQNIYVQTNKNGYDRTKASPVASYQRVAYQVRFTNDDYGVAYCTSSAVTNDSACQTSDQTQTHRLPVQYLGSTWTISAMNPPSGLTAASNTQYPIHGGSISLAKESAYKIVNIGETLDAGNFKVKLSDISVAVGSNNVHPAIVDILDANGATLSQQQITPGTTYTFTSGGQSAKIHVYQTSPGFTLNAKWAEMAVYSDELTLTDNQKVDSSSNQDWKVELLWKNRDTSVDQVSALREIMLYSDVTTGNLFSGTMSKYAAGDSLTFLTDPAVFKLTFGGIDLADADYDGLQFQMQTGVSIPVANNGTGDVCDGNATTITNPVVTVTTGVSNGFQVNTVGGGSPSNNLVYYDLVANKLYVKSGDNNCYFWQGLASSNATIQYKTAGTIGNSANGGAIIVNNVNASYDNFVIYEDAGRYNTSAQGVDSMAFFITNQTNGNTWSFKPNGDSTTGQVTFTDAGGVNVHSEEAPYMSDRGSLFTSMTTDTTSFNIAKRVGNLQWTLSSTGTNTSDASQFTLGEGESKSITGGITVKLDSISETVGSCTASGAGAPSCTVDMTPVKAVILPDNVATVQVSQPYKLTSKMVVLDSEASSAGSVITVGGPAVNTVTADALAGSSVDLSTTTVLVQAIGNKIVVAGLTAADTVTAADRFIAGIKQQ